MDTTTMPVAEQFRSWAAHSRNSQLTPGNDGAFRAQGAFWDLGSAVMAEVRLDPFVSDRTLEMVRATGADHLQIVAIFDGCVRFQSGDLDQSCRAGDVFVRDYARPSRATSTRIHCATVSLRRRFFEHLAGPVDVNGVLPNAPESALLNTMLRAMARHLPYVEASSAPFYARMLRDMLAAATIGLPRSRPVSRDGSRRADVQAYIAAQPPGALSIPAMLDRLGMTRSTLYRLFRQDGGVIAYDRMRRLRALYRDITDPLESRSIADLGARQGFFEKAVLARTFKATFGCSISELRRRAKAGPHGRAGGDTAHMLREAVEELTRG